MGQQVQVQFISPQCEEIFILPLIWCSASGISKSPNNVLTRTLEEIRKCSSLKTLVPLAPSPAMSASFDQKCGKFHYFPSFVSYKYAKLLCWMWSTECGKVNANSNAILMNIMATYYLCFVSLKFDNINGTRRYRES